MKKNYLIIALLFSSIIFGQTTFSVPNGLWSNAANWSNGLPNPTSTSDVTLNANVNLDSNQTIGGFLRSGTSTVSGTGTLTSAGTFTGALLCVDTNFTFNSNLVLNGTNTNTIKSLQVNNDVGSTTARQLTLGPLSVLTLTTPASVVTGPSSKVVFQGKIQGAAGLFFNGVAEFDALSDNTGFNGEMVFNTSTANVIANTTGTAAFLKVNQKIQVNGTGGSLTLNGANSCNGYLSVGGTNAFTMHINANQTSFGSIIVGNGPLTIKVAPAVTNLSFANSAVYSWGTGTIAITGYQSGEIRFGTNSAALTTAQLSRITADGAATGLPLALDANGYLVLGDTFSYFTNASGAGNGLWSTATNWTALRLPTQNVQLSADVNLDSNFSITGLVRNGTNTISGTGTLTLAGATADGLISNGANFTFNSNLVINCTTPGTPKSLQVNNNTASNRQLTFGPLSVLTLTTTAMVTTQPNSKVVFQGKIQGAASLNFHGVAEFDAASDNTGFTGEMGFNVNSVNVIANTTGAGAFLRAGSRVQVNNTGCSLTLNGANSYNGNLSVAATNAFALNINANQPSFGNIINTDGTLTINVAAAVTNLSFASSAANSWGTGTIAFTGYQSGEIRFGTNSSALTATQLSRITADGTASGRALTLNASGYLVVVPPTITQLTSNGTTVINQGCGGSNLVITGTGFTGATAVTVNGIAVSSFTVNSNTQITAVLAAGPIASGSVVVTSGGVPSTTGGNFAVNANVTPTFTQVTSICSGGSLSALPTTSSNSISGTWSPALNNTATTLYTFTPSAGLCRTTATMTITVNPNVTPTFTQVASICSGGSLSALPTTSSNSISGTWSPALNNTATTLYTFTPTAGLCATSATMTITVNPNVTPTFTQVASICSGGSLSALPTTSSNSISGTWSPALNNTATTLYTFTPTAGLCARTATMTITVNPNTTTGSVTQSQVGGTYTWPANGVTYSSSAVATVVSGCNTATLNLTITPITETIWNGSSWNYGAPTATIDAIINGTYSTTSNGAISAKNLTVNSGVSLTVNSSASVTVAAALVNNGGVTGGIVVENNANLIQTATTDTNSGSGSVTVNRNSNNLKRLDYTLWSTPVKTGNRTIGSFSSLTTSTRNYIYNASTNVYNSVSNLGTFNPGTGYLIRMPDQNPSILGNQSDYYKGLSNITFNGVFTGTALNNGPITITTAANTFNAIGNPYPSTISATAFLNANNTDGILYFWRKTNGLGTSYATYTTTGAVGNGGISAPNGTIQVGQGFIVKANGTSLVFNNTMRVNPSASTQFFKTKKADLSRFWLNLNNVGGMINQTLVGYMDAATKGVDKGIDGKSFGDGAIELASSIDGESYTIQGRPAFDTTDVVALNFKTTIVGTYSIAIDHVDGLFSNGQAVYLVDKNTNVTTNLTEGAYSFTAAAGVDNTRFELTYQKTLKIDAPLFNENSVLVSRSNGTVNVKSTSVAINNVKVYDVQGRLVAERKNVKSNTASFSNLRTNQVLIVKVTSENNAVVTKKVIN